MPLNPFGKKPSGVLPPPMLDPMSTLKKGRNALTGTDDPSVDIFTDERLSYGTNGVIQGLRQLPENIPKHLIQPRIIAFDIVSLARNIYDNKLTHAELLQRLEEEISLIVLHMDGFLAAQYQDIPIVFYANNYRGYYPKLILRDPPSRETEDCEMVVAAFIRKAQKHPLSGRYSIKWPETRVNPIKWLRDTLGDGNQPGSIFLASSHAVDYHIVKFAPTFIVQRYTGKILGPESFSKAVFSFPDEKFYKQVPFNSVTHSLFGDKYTIRPFVIRKNKKIALETAERERWALMTEAAIRVSCSSMNFQPLYDLTR